MDRRAVRPEPSGRETLAAANSRSVCVFWEGCPVLSLHLSFGLAPHIGQRTDNICPKVRFPGFQRLVIRHLGNWRLMNLALRDLACFQNGNLPGNGLSFLIAAIEPGNATGLVMTTLRLVRA